MDQDALPDYDAPAGHHAAANQGEDTRKLPDGWVKQWDEEHQCYCYVDTQAEPPRTLWVHPYDDPAFVASLPEKHPARMGIYEYDAPPDDGTSQAGPSTASEVPNTPEEPVGTEPAQKAGLFARLRGKLGGREKGEAESKQQGGKDQAAREGEAGSSSPAFSFMDSRHPNGIRVTPQASGLAALPLSQAGGMANGMILGQLFGGSSRRGKGKARESAATQDAEQ